jgi:hypothetical protein
MQMHQHYQLLAEYCLPVKQTIQTSTNGTWSSLCTVMAHHIWVRVTKMATYSDKNLGSFIYQ